MASYLAARPVFLCSLALPAYLIISNSAGGISVLARLMAQLPAANTLAESSQRAQLERAEEMKRHTSRLREFQLSS